MKQKLLITLLGLSLLFTACSSPDQATATPEAIPTVIADSTIIAEGRVEPIRYAEIAFNASGVVTFDVWVKLQGVIHPQYCIRVPARKARSIMDRAPYCASPRNVLQQRR